MPLMINNKAPVMPKKWRELVYLSGLKKMSVILELSNHQCVNTIVNFHLKFGDGDGPNSVE